MRLSLRSGERLFVNGAVLRFERKSQVEVLNDVHFLVENHVMQAEEATTPVRRLYYIVQLMLIEPARAAHLAPDLSDALDRAALPHEVEANVACSIAGRRYHEAMKLLRTLFEPAS